MNFKTFFTKQFSHCDDELYVFCTAEGYEYRLTYEDWQKLDNDDEVTIKIILTIPTSKTFVGERDALFSIDSESIALQQERTVTKIQAEQMLPQIEENAIEFVNAITGGTQYYWPE